MFVRTNTVVFDSVCCFGDLDFHRASIARRSCSLWDYLDRWAFHFRRRRSVSRNLGAKFASEKKSDRADPRRDDECAECDKELDEGREKWREERSRSDIIDGTVYIEIIDRKSRIEPPRRRVRCEMRLRRAIPHRRCIAARYSRWLPIPRFPPFRWNP